MTTVPANLANPSPGADASEHSTLRADPLSTGVVFLLAMTIVQRLVGFLRSVLFCSLLEDDQLGRWSLALIFLTLAAPLVVLGLPGSFGRYAEHYRRKGQLRCFFRRTTLVSATLGASAVLLLLIAPKWFAACIFKDAEQTRLVVLLGATLGIVIAGNFLTELLTALRQYRIVSLTQMASSVVFAVLGVSLLYGTPLREEAVILAFGAGALAASLVAAFRLRAVWGSLHAASDPLPQRELWSRLLPFAAWVWVINLLANLFDGADQYMIKHFSGLDASAADALVGQYHCSRVLPVLMIGVAGMLSSFILPQISADWESGRRDVVSQRLNLALKLIALTFTGAGVLMMLGAPLLFGWVLRGKYDAGLAVLPWTLIYCIWFGLATVAQAYLWCAEKARVGGLALGFGLAVNLVLNLLLLPRWGLVGAVWATATANAVAVALIYLLSQRLGMQLDRRVWFVSLLPLVMAIPPAQATVVVMLAAWLAARGNWLFDSREKQELWETASGCFEMLRRGPVRRQPASA